MIYGMNFNNTVIPAGVKRRFPARVKVLCPKCKNAARVCFTCSRGTSHIAKADGTGAKARGWLWYYLQGVAQSTEERDEMLIQADNGHRRLHVEARQTAAGTWYGIYVY